MPPEAAPAVLPVPVLGPPPLPRIPAPERWTLANGLRVTALPKAGIPQVVLRLVLPAGSVADPPEYPGAASLVGQLLTEGTESMSADELNERIDRLGASLNVTVGHDFAEAEAVLLAETLVEGIELLAEVVTRPAFPPDETERVRAESLDAVIARLDEPANLADDRAALEVFGAEHPYGRPAFGTAEGIAAVPREALAEVHAARYRPGGAFLVAAGDFDPAVLRGVLERALAHWTGEAAPLAYPSGEPRPAAAGRTVAVEWEDAAQSEIRIAGGGLDRRSADWVPAVVANYLLGGSTITGRLGANLREDKGWTYGVHSGFSAGLVPGGWMVNTAVDVEVADDAVREILGEMRRLMDEPVGAEELQRAKDALVLSLPRLFETPAGLASRFATVEAYGLPHDYWEGHAARVRAVTPEDVRRIARRHFDPDAVVRVVVGGGTDDEG